jgi:hypothetical protein
LYCNGVFGHHFGPCGTNGRKNARPSEDQGNLGHTAAQTSSGCLNFIGLSQFNCIYISGYVHVMEPITRLMHKTEEFDWIE